MVAPASFKLVCPKCQYSKIVKPKSDVLSAMDFINSCPKCGTQMEKESLNFFSTLKGFF